MTVTDWIQAISMVVLVIITGIYAWRTHVISKATNEQAKATKQQADASVKMAEEMRDTRYDTVRPVIDFQWQDSNIVVNSVAMMEGTKGKVPIELSCKLRNVGFGPAIELYSYSIVGQDNRNRYDFETLVAGGKTVDWVALSIRQEGNIGVLEAHYRDIYDRSFTSKLEVYSVKEKGLQTKLKVEKVQELPK